MLRKDIHRQFLYNCIKAIFSHPIAKHLAFKWWTACYFFYDLPRFSTDIDIDLISPIDEDIDAVMASILKPFGTLKQGHHSILSYGDSDTNIHIDINRRIRTHNHYEIKNFFGTDMKVQTLDTIVANKLVALLERWAQRDFFDVYDFLYKAYPINEALIEERTGHGLDQLRKKIVQRIDALGSKSNILQSLGETLQDEKQKSWVKTHLLRELKGMVMMRAMR